MLSFKFTRRKPKIPKLLKALSRGQIEKAMIRPTEKAAVHVAENKLHGQVLGIVSGNLSRSILPSVKTKGLRASLGTSFIYGKAWEEGTVPGKKARKWLQPGTEEFVKSGKYVELFKAELLKELNR